MMPAMGAIVAPILVSGGFFAVAHTRSLRIVLTPVPFWLRRRP
jgi:hypothetical protein